MATKYGTNSPNTLSGTSSADTLYGRGGNDTLNGLGGNDRLYGEAGNDILKGGLGNDRLDGGTGIDRITYYNDGGTRGVIIDLGAGRATRGSETDTLVSIEDVYGSFHADIITGNEGTNKLEGSRGDDTLSGGNGDDIVAGGLGNDRLDGGPGFDLGTWQSDNAGGVTIDLAAGTATRGGETDSLANLEGLIGTDWNDALRGDAGDNRLGASPN